MTLETLKDKKILIAGLGVNNRKMADYFSARNIHFDVVENWKSLDDLKDKFFNYDVIFRTPGLPYRCAPIQAAHAAGVTISSQTKLFFKLCPAQIIGVTGTKGKGTTASLIYAILTAAQDKLGGRVYLAGNFGRDPFEFLDDLTARDFVVMELSSFQLQDLEQSPHIAVVLSITPDHLDHHTSMAEYIVAKSNLVKFQNASDVAILSKHVPPDISQFGGNKIWIEPSVVKDYPSQLLGDFNRENIAAAVLVAKQLGVDDTITRAAVADFQPLPHRLQPILTSEEITYIDDSFSTNVESTVAALDAVPGQVVLIVGGFDKGFDWTSLGEKIKQDPKVIGIVVIGAVTEKILKAIQGYQGSVLTGAKNMIEIVSQAKSLAKSGTTVLLSPGTSSFDMFQSATDRAEQFKAEIRKV